ncbi:uncharacterized protein LOC106161363 [Lingula anatina]|uniref:Uncharacterized protein LOC106161363 n=1 Tax=Lingula anatina TaxID=7574 RepID=A0A1S3K3P7_LINAN|nr:uncharacterized protein LOC106161363 [Lingula anatina]|eukprot:XP_013393754.1 uncharacterized protein LOC106161363 [Lingula anatina]
MQCGKYKCTKKRWAIIMILSSMAFGLVVGLAVILPASGAGAPRININLGKGPASVGPGAIAGIIIGVIVVICLIVLVTLIFYCKKVPSCIQTDNGRFKVFLKPRQESTGKVPRRPRRHRRPHDEPKIWGEQEMISVVKSEPAGKDVLDGELEVEQSLQPKTPENEENGQELEDEVAHILSTSVGGRYEKLDEEQSQTSFKDDMGYIHTQV